MAFGHGDMGVRQRVRPEKRGERPEVRDLMLHAIMRTDVLRCHEFTAVTLTGCVG